MRRKRDGREGEEIAIRNNFSWKNILHEVSAKKKIYKKRKLSE